MTKRYNFKGPVNFEQDLLSIENPKEGDMYYVKYKLDESTGYIKDYKVCFVYVDNKFVILQLDEDENESSEIEFYKRNIIDFIEDVCNVELKYYQKIMINKYFKLYDDRKVDDN